ncbi:MAG: YveK family protein [Atopobiaceae bacterium]|jgi:capsular polysaccharide biosynthesis protein
MTLLELFQLLRKHLKLVLILPIACALVAAVYTMAFMQNEYTASTSMYVMVKNSNEGSQSTAISSDLNASQMISSDVSTLLKSDRVSEQVAEKLGLGNLRDYDVSVTSTTTSRVITLSVTGPDAQVAANVANGMVEAVSSIANQVMEVDSVNAIDEAYAPSAPSGPNRPLYMLVACAAGLFAAIAIVVIMDMFDTRVHNQEEVEELLDGVSVIGRIPYSKEM